MAPLLLAEDWAKIAGGGAAKKNTSSHYPVEPDCVLLLSLLGVEAGADTKEGEETRGVCDQVDAPARSRNHLSRQPITQYNKHTLTTKTPFY
uniref:Uncharacterized protein n=1 Tax=Ditylenchus dipsaci TaxID=166011 RepID=A0A915DKJ6_9BILA